MSSPALLRAQWMARSPGRALLLMIALAIAPDEAAPQDVLIANGLGLAAAQNRIDADSAEIHVRNLGCPDGWPAAPIDGPCPSPGASTSVCVLAPATLPAINVYDDSTLNLEGGEAGAVDAMDAARVEIQSGTASAVFLSDSSRLIMSGGSLFDGISCIDDAGVTMLRGAIRGVTGIRAFADCVVHHWGGSIEGPLEAYNRSTIYIYGSNFQLDGSPVPDGPLIATGGLLTGTLSSGEAIATEVYGNGHSPVLTGTIVLGPAATAPGLGPVSLTALAGLLAVVSARHLQSRRNAC